MYEIADPAHLPSRPDLSGTVVLRATADEAIDAAAADFFIHAVNCVRSFGDFHVAIATEPGAEPLLRRLMYDPACRDLPWSRAHVWLLDEIVDSPDAFSRAAALRELVVLPSGIPEGQVHTIDRPAESPDVAYEAELREHLGWREKGHDRLDYVLMGAAPPITLQSAGAEATDRLVVVMDEAGSRRITMTPRMVGGARFVGVVALGEPARPLLLTVRKGAHWPGHPDDPRSVLASERGPVGGELRWYVDSAACPEGRGGRS